MANPNELIVNLAADESDDDEEEQAARAPPAGQPRRDRLERIALFDFLRLVAENREPAPGYRAIGDLVAHLKSNGTLTSDAVSRALLACPRDLFVPPAHRGEALADRPIRVEAAGFNISAPHVQVVALQALALDPGQRVLDVGCGCGIVTAYAAYLAGSTGEVVGIDIRDSALALSTSSLQRLRDRNDEFSELAAPITLEHHNVFVPLRRHQGRYDAVYVGAAMPETRLGAILDLLGPRGGRIVAPVNHELRLVTKSPDGVVRQRVLSQVSFSELEVPRDVDVVRALVQERAEEARRVVVPPSTFASDLAHLAAPGADLAAVAAHSDAAATAATAPPPPPPAAAPGPGPGPSTSSSSYGTASSPRADDDPSRRSLNGIVRPRSLTSLARAHLASATLPPAHRPSGRESANGADAAAALTPAAAGAAAAAAAAEAAGDGCEMAGPGAGAASSGLAAVVGGWSWQWERPPTRRREGSSPGWGGGEGGGEGGEGGGDSPAAAGEKDVLMAEATAAEAPAGPVEAEESVGAAVAAVAAAGSGAAAGEEGPGAGGGGADGGLPYLSFAGEILALGVPDCELEGAGWRLPAHRAVLQARCELLRAHMSSGMRDSDSTRYTVPEVVERRDAVEAFLHYVYKDRLPDDVGPEVVPQLLHAATYFGCSRLVRLCEALLARELLAASAPIPGPNPATAPGPAAAAAAAAAAGSDPEVLEAAVGAAGPLLALADEGGLDQLRRVALNFVLDHFPAVSASEGYRQLPRPLVDSVAAEAVGRYGELLQQLARLGGQSNGLGEVDD